MSCDIRDIDEAVLVGDSDFGAAWLQFLRYCNRLFSIFWIAHIRNSDSIGDGEIQSEILHITGIVLEL